MDNKDAGAQRDVKNEESPFGAGSGDPAYRARRLRLSPVGRAPSRSALPAFLNMP